MPTEPQGEEVPPPKVVGGRPAEKPVWARLSFWLFIGSFMGTMSFCWYQRVALSGAFRAHLPNAKMAGRAFLKDAKDWVGKTDLESQGDGTAHQPSASTLSAPVDPSRRFAKVPRRAKVRSSARGRRMLRDVRGRGRKSASEVQEVKQYMGAYDVSFERELTFWESDMGLGIIGSLAISFFFFCLGNLLFMRTSHGPRKLS